MKQSSLRVLALMLAVVSCTSSAFAVDATVRTKARDLVNDGVEEFEAGHFEVARVKFMDAAELVQAPTVAVWAARAHEKLGKLVEAAELYQLALVMKPNELWSGQTQQKAQKDASVALEALKQRIPTVRVEIPATAGTNVVIVIDDVMLPMSAPSLERQVNPGSHVVAAKRDGQILMQETIVLAEGDRRMLPLRLPDRVSHESDVRVGMVALRAGQIQPMRAPDASPSKWRRNLTWATLGVGAAGLTLGTVAGVVTIMKHSELRDDNCSDTTCRGLQFEGRVDSHNTWRAVSTVSYIVGGVGAAAGVTLMLLPASKETGPKIGIAVGPGAVAINGVFR
jgi:hypothetical protein